MKKLSWLAAVSALLIGSSVFVSCGGSDSDGGSDPVLDKITVDVSAAKTVFAVGDAFSAEGLSVKAVMSDKTKKSLSADEYTVALAAANLDENDKIIRATGNGHSEEAVVTVTYEEKTATYNVTVSDVVTKLALDATGAKTEYELNEEFDVTGITVKAFYGEDDAVGEDVTESATFTATVKDDGGNDGAEEEAFGAEAIYDQVDFDRIDGIEEATDTEGCYYIVTEDETGGAVYTFLAGENLSGAVYMQVSNAIEYIGTSSEGSCDSLYFYAPRTLYQVIKEKPAFGILNAENFSELYSRLSAVVMTDQVYGNDSIKGRVDSGKGGLLYLSMPYLPGFKAYVDGEECDITDYLDGIGIDLSEGTHDIELRYIPKGIWAGSLSSKSLSPAEMADNTGILSGLALGGIEPLRVSDHLIGAAAVSGFLLILYLATKGRGIGGGDIKLMAAAGLFLGWKNCILAFVIGCVLGSVIHLIRMKVSKQDHVLAFGPYLAAGIFIASLWGEKIVNLYLSYF